MQSDETCPMCGGPEPCRECYEYALDAVGAPIGLGKEQEMNLTGLDLGAWLTKSGTIVLLTYYDEVVHMLVGHTVHPMRKVRYGKDGRLVSCCFLPGESQTVEHEQKLHEGLHLDKMLGDVDAVITVNQVEWEKSYAGSPATPAPHEDWVEITDPRHVLRKGIDQIFSYAHCGFVPVDGSAGMTVGELLQKGYQSRCLREHHPGFAPARRQDSAGAGIYDEMPPLVNTYADRTLNASKLLKDAVNEAKDVFTDSSANIEVIPPTEYRFHVCTAESDWNIRGTHFEWHNAFIAVYLRDDCVAWIRNAESCTRENPYP